MRRDLLTSAIAIVLFTLVLGAGYPLVITAISQGAFPGNANGQRVYVGGKLVGSKIIGQSFETAAGRPDPRYFQTRPSATVPVDNAQASTFSNLGPNNVATEQAIATNIEAYLRLERPYDPGLGAAQVPVDAADSSASGIDPDISLANAWIQAHRIAAVRGLSLRAVDALIATHTSGRFLGFSGEPSVNVLELNLSLDRAAGSR